MREPGDVPNAQDVTDPTVAKLAETLDATALEPDNLIQLLDAEEAVARVTGELLAAGTPVAVDFEGRDLCRAGKLDLVQLSNGTRTWLIDVTTLGDAAFSAGARALLESNTVLKVGYDGRADADALWHLHQTMLTNFYDVQVASCKRQDATEGRRDRVVHGLGRAMDAFLRGDRARQATMAVVKDAGRKLFAPELGGSYDVWAERPLSETLIEYAGNDVALLLEMREAWERYSPTNTNVNVSSVRISKAVHGPRPAKGRQMALKDF
jgi:exonuclease 3'-5' domain-containing protein 1